MIKYYAVRAGIRPGVYTSWDECEEQVSGYTNAKFKKFDNEADALAFVNATENHTLQAQKVDNVTLSVKIDPTKQIPPQGVLKAYVDGSFRPNDESISYGVVLLHTDGREEYFSKRVLNHPDKKMRNIVGETLGAMVAMKEAIRQNYHTIEIYYDYAGIEKWALGEWRTNNALTQNYRAFVNNISEYLTIKFHKIKAHTGDKYNEMADELATNA